MEKRVLNISFSKSGSGSENTRISLPVTWIREMGITKDDRSVNVIYSDGKITITK